MILGEGAATGMAGIIETIGSVFTGIMGWASDVVTFVVETPLVMVAVGLGLVATVIAMVRKFIPR